MTLLEAEIVDFISEKISVLPKEEIRAIYIATRSIDKTIKVLQCMMNFRISPFSAIACLSTPYKVTIFDKENFILGESFVYPGSFQKTFFKANRAGKIDYVNFEDTLGHKKLVKEAEVVGEHIEDEGDLMELGLYVPYITGAEDE